MERTRSCDSEAEPTLFLGVFTRPPVEAEEDKLSPAAAGSPRSPASPQRRKLLDEKLEAAASRREEALEECVRRCGQHVQRARAISARQKKQRELTLHEKRMIAEKVMEAATRRRDEHLLQRAQGPASPRQQRSAASSDGPEEQVASEAADTVIEHALFDQRMLRATALKSAQDSPEAARCRRDRARELLSAQMGRAARRKAALASQQDRAAANRERIKQEKAEKLREHAKQVEERRQLARQPRKFRSKRPAQLSLSVSITPAAATTGFEPLTLSGQHKSTEAAAETVQEQSSPSLSEAVPPAAPAAAMETADALSESPEHSAARLVQAAWFRFLVRRDLSRSSRSLHRLLGASLPSAEFEELTDLLQQPKLIAKAMALLTHAATAAYPSRTTAKPKVMPASRRKARSFLAAFLIATHRDACLGTEAVEGGPPPPPPTEVEDLTHAAATAVVAAFDDLLSASRKAGGAVNGSPAGRYRVLNRAVVRSQHTIESDKLGTLEAGQTIQVLEVVVDAAGRIRALCAGNNSDEMWLRGWVSIENGSGGVLLERCAGTAILSPRAARLIAAFRCFETRFDAWRSNDNKRLLNESIGMVVEMERLRIYWNGEGPDVSAARAELERGIAQIGGVEAQTRLADSVAEVQSSYNPRALGQSPSSETPQMPPSTSPGRVLFQPPVSPLNPSQAGDHDQTVRQLMEETSLDDAVVDHSASASEASESPERTMNEMDNLRLAHELQINPGQFNLPGVSGPRRSRSAPTSAPSAGGALSARDAAAHAEMVAAIEQQARRAFWTMLVEQLSAEPVQYEMLLGLLDEAFEMLKALAPDSHSWMSMVSRCDMQLLRQQAEHGAVDTSDLLQALTVAMEALCVGGTEEAEDEARAWSIAALEALTEAAEERGIVGVATTLPAVFEGFWERLEAVKEAAAAYRLQPALQALATHGAEYERAAFERDFPIGMDMPRTEAWLNDTPAPARDVGKTVAAGVARLLCSAESPTAETLPETLVLDADRLESLHEQAARLTIVASAGLLVKQALTKVGVPLKLIAQVVDEPALASEAGQSTATTEQLTPREETLVPVLRTGLAGILEPPTTATFTTQVGGGNEEEGTADGHVEDGELASPIARRMLPDIFHLLEPPAPPEDSVLTVISGGCAAVCAQAGIEWSDKENQALQTALRGVLTGRSPILTVMKKRLGSALAAALLPDGPVAEMVPAPQELKKHGLAAVALPLVALATAARVVCDHQLKVHGTRLAAMLAAQ